MERSTLLILALLAAGCTSQQKPGTHDPIRVETCVVEASSVAAKKNYVGVIEEEQAAALSFPIGGTVARIFFDEGQRVKQGDLLAELDPASARQSYNAAKATLEQAQDATRRLQRLYDEQSLPEIKWVEAQTKLSQAESAYGIAEKNLKDCALRAPFSGVIGKRSATVGETALPGVPVMTLLKIGVVKVRFAVPEQEIGGLHAADRIAVTVPALGEKLFQASNLEKGAVANAATHTYDVRATIANPASELLPGMVSRVDVTPAGAAEEIVVPLCAVQQVGDGSRFVWTVQGDMVAETAVETGRLSGNGIVIAGGLRAGDRIITGGMQKIGAGDKIVWE